VSVRALYPADLLEQATYLADQGVETEAPRTIDLRAAISRSYYAVFHEITWSAAQMLIDGRVTASRPESSYPVTRWISHAGVLKLTQAVCGSGNLALRDVLAGAPPELEFACGVFIDLQGLRHKADYGHDFDVDRITARNAVAQARRVLEALDALAGCSDPHYLRFLRLASGSTEIAKKR
jgi:hypothetical protein